MTKTSKGEEMMAVTCDELSMRAPPGAPGSAPGGSLLQGGGEWDREGGKGGSGPAVVVDGLVSRGFVFLIAGLDLNLKKGEVIGVEPLELCLHL